MSPSYRVTALLSIGLAAASLGGLRGDVAVSTAASTAATAASTAGGLVPQSSGQSSGSTFQSLQRVDAELGVRATQIRRVSDSSGRLMGVTESLEVRPWMDQFQLEPIGITGSGTAAPSAEVVDYYDRYAGFIFRHQSFRVHDAQLAMANYVLYALDYKIRAGRLVERCLVIPKHLDRSLWLLELDVATGYPLYRAEYDSTFQLVSELEVVSFDTIAEGNDLPGQDQMVGHWTPAYQMTTYPDAESARLALGPQGQRMELPDSDLLGWGFSSHLHVVARHYFDPNAQSLVTGFTDGVDEVFFVQGEGRDPFAGVMARLSSRPSAASAATETHAITRFQDRNVRQYAFHHDGVLTTVVGRGSQLGLDAAAKGFYRRAVR